MFLCLVSTVTSYYSDNTFYGNPTTYSFSSCFSQNCAFASWLHLLILYYFFFLSGIFALYLVIRLTIGKEVNTNFAILEEFSFYSICILVFLQTILTIYLLSGSNKDAGFYLELVSYLLLLINLGIFIRYKYF